MKKVKYIALALVLCLGLIGGAYAWWTDTLEIDGTVATGNMEVIFSNVEGTNGDYEVVSDYMITDLDGEASRKVTFNVTNLYPRVADDGRDYATMSVTIRNNSSIPVKVTSVSVEASEYLRFWRGEPETDGTWDMDADGLETHLSNALIDNDPPPLAEDGGEHEVTTLIYLGTGIDAPQGVTDGSVTLTLEFGQFNYE